MNKSEKRIIKYQAQQSAERKFPAKGSPYGGLFASCMVNDNSNGIRKVVNKIIK